MYLEPHFSIRPRPKKVTIRHPLRPSQERDMQSGLIEDLENSIECVGKKQLTCKLPCNYFFPTHYIEFSKSSMRARPWTMALACELGPGAQESSGTDHLEQREPARFPTGLHLACHGGPGRVG